MYFQRLSCSCSWIIAAGYFGYSTRVFGQQNADGSLTPGAFSVDIYNAPRFYSSFPCRTTCPKDFPVCHRTYQGSEVGK